jgi:hypothetical protein
MLRITFPAILLAAAATLPVAATACASEPAATADPAATQAETAESEKKPHRVIVRKVSKVSMDDAAMVDMMGADGETKVIRVVKHGDHTMHVAECPEGEGDEDVFKFEFRDESEDGSDVQVSVICLTGDEARPENKAAALEQAIARLEAEGEREAAHRARTLEKLRAELARLNSEAE